MTGFPRLAPGTFCSRKRQLMLEPSEQDTMPRQAALSDGPAPAGRTGEAKRTAQEGSASPRPVPPGGSHCRIRSSSPDKPIEKPHSRPSRHPGTLKIILYPTSSSTHPQIPREISISPPITSSLLKIVSSPGESTQHSTPVLSQHLIHVPLLLVTVLVGRE